MMPGIGKMLRKTQQIVRGYMKESAESLNICQTGLILIVLYIGNLPLRHVKRITELTLI